MNGIILTQRTIGGTACGLFASAVCRDAAK